MEILQPGVWNHQAGPDFADATVSFSGGPPVRGAIELDPDVRDWERHGHSANPEYEGVVLHVFVRRGAAEFFTRTLGHRHVPQVWLGAPPETPGLTPGLTPGTVGICAAAGLMAGLSLGGGEALLEAVPGRCVLPLNTLPAARIRRLLGEAAERRTAAKALALGRLAEWHGHEEALYQGVAGALGYRGNELAFTLLAQRVPLRVLAEAGPAGEALLFGVSGFLCRPEAGMPAPTREYLRSLWDRWWPLRAEWEKLRLPSGLWRVGGQRPANHPHRRLAALSVLAGRWNEFRRLRRASGDPTDFFRSLRHPYWDRHFSLGSRTSPGRLALIGRGRSSEICANVLVPLGAAARGSKGRPPATPGSSGAAPGGGGPGRKAGLNRRLVVVWQRLFGRRPPEREWLQDAWFQQGLLQLYQEFCARDCSGCRGCRFPEQLERWAEEPG